MAKDITLEQSLQAYRVMSTPTKLSWKQHWAQEVFSNDDYMLCDEDEKIQFTKRLKECQITICSNIKQHEGVSCTLKELVDTIISEDNKNCAKINRKVIYSTANGERPVGKKAFELWNGFQVIDMDIKDADLAQKLKEHIFKSLNKCNWFLGVTLSSSGKGLHIYTKILISEADQKDIKRKKLLFLTNFRHKYSFVYIACLNVMEKYSFGKDDLLKWMDLAMFKPQQGAFIGYDEHPLINTKFFEDFIYMNFDNIEDLGHPDIDWVTYSDLKEIFRRWEWFEDDDSNDIEVEVKEAKDLEFDTHNKIHYKHNERWRLANTLVKLYGLEKGFKYLRLVCSNNISDKELQADCITAARHQKPIDTWAVSRLNSQHGFQIKLNITNESFDESTIFNSVDKIDNPTLIIQSKNTKTFHISKDEYLGNIKWELLENVGRVTLIEAGAGVGKTEMIKSLVRDGKKVIMVMPFTSTIKSKVEGDENWYYSYGSRKPRLDMTPGVSMTIDKFSHMNLMDIKANGFDYIIIDESHLMFQSEYRPVMAKIIEMIRNTEVPIILMSGTPSGEIVFFPDIVHLRVIKEDVRKKEFKVNLVENTNDLMFHMCRSMARDIAQNKRILFPTNKGTLFSEQIKAAVQYFLEKEHFMFEEVRMEYYKKSNLGDQFMDDINFDKTIRDTQILLCSNYLSVGVDILDKFQFNIYFDDLMMPQEVEQFANRLRSNDLYINLYIAKNDSDGNSRSIHKFRPMNFKLNDEEIKDVHSILRLCNSMIERNPLEYKYNSLVASIIHDNKFIEYNDVENKYYLNEIAYKVIYFERKYREYVQQLPVLMKGMMAYGYEISSKDLGNFKIQEGEIFSDLKNLVKLAYDERLQLNTHHVEELMDIITEDRLTIYRDVLQGLYEIKKGTVWKEDIFKKTMTVKNVEVFEKVVPLFVSMSKQYNVEDIKDIFEYCRNKNKTFNFAAIKRIKLLINILYNNKQERLDLPIQDFMNRVYELCQYEKIKASEVRKFIHEYAQQYAVRESQGDIKIYMAQITMEKIQDTFDKIFKCLVKMSRPNKQGICTLEKVELLWKEREEYDKITPGEHAFLLADFLGNHNVDIESIHTDKYNSKEIEI
jgi:hypothetical protein